MDNNMEITRGTKDTRFEIMNLKIKNNKLSRQLMMAVIFCVLCTVVSIVSVSAFIICSNRLAEVEKDNYDLTCDLMTAQLQIATMQEEYDAMVIDTKEYEVTIASLYTIAETVVEENASLAQANDSYYEEILAYQQREELYDKYGYAITREDGTRTDLTYDQISLVENLCSQLSVDVDLVLSIVMVESSGTEDATSSISTARGYGQFLDSSGEYVYEEIMEWGEYDHDYAYDGDTNLSMIVYYLNYLYKLYDNDLYSVIKQYRGESGSSLWNYIWKLDQYLQNNGKSIAYLDSIT